MEGGHLAPAQDRAKTKNQLAHDRETGHCRFRVSTICVCWLGWESQVADKRIHGTTRKQVEAVLKKSVPTCNPYQR